MSIFRTIAMFTYLFGYMIVHYGVLRKAERAQAAGDTETVRRLVEQHIPHWSRGILHITGVRLSVEGLDNIPKEGPCVFVANHRSYYDIPCCWPASTGPTASSPRRSWKRSPCSAAG